jgi:hypothetical protein
MQRKDTPDIYKLQKSGDIRTLLRLLRHSKLDVSTGSAAALASMGLNPRQKKKAQAQIGRKLKKLESINSPILKRDVQKYPSFKYNFFTSDDYVAIGVYKQSLIQMDKINPAVDLFRNYCVWFDVYMNLLQQHKYKHNDTFKLALDSDRIRHSQIEQIAKRVLSLGSKSQEFFKDDYFQLRFIISTVGILDLLDSLEGYEFLSRSGSHESDHDWALSRSVYKGLVKLLEQCIGIKHRFDMSKLRDNIMALWIKGEIDLNNSRYYDAKTLSLIEKRTDLIFPMTESKYELFKMWS